MCITVESPNNGFFLKITANFLSNTIMNIADLLKAVNHPANSGGLQ